MPQMHGQLVERIASALRNGNADEAKILLIEHPEYRAFLDLGDSIRGDFRDSITGSISRIDSWLDYAEAHGHPELRAMLGQHFWDPIYRGIYDAIRLGNVDELRQVFEEHPRYIDGVQHGIGSWLIDAAHYGHLPIAEFLVEKGANVNARRFATDSPLNSAVGFAGPEMVKYLLTQGANPNFGRQLVGAINRDPEELALRLVQLLVEHGADVNQTFTVFGDKNNTFTALEWAANKPSIAEYLRSKGAVERKKQAPGKAVPKNLAEEIIAYFAEHFGPAQPQSQIEIVPTEPPIAIHVIPATEDRKHVTLFTTGMSEQPMQVPDDTGDFRFAELFIQLRGNWPIDKKSLSNSKYAWPIHWLRSIAKYPHQHNTSLGGPVTIIANGDPPEPLASGVKFTSMLVMVDSNFTSRDGRTICLYRLMPLYTEERNLEIKHGIAALMRAFDKHDVPTVVDLARPNVAT